MGFKKKTKVSAQFNMSSLTDIIFLLLIFFMLTSSMVIPNALNLRLPGKSNSQPQLDTKPYEVTIDKSGQYFVNQKRVSLDGLENGLVKLKEMYGGKKPSIIISPDSEVPNEYVVAVMDIAYRLEIDAIMTKPK
ncbi:MAG: biopolymer transporter ExbD [Saprospiraceae bacterium]